MGRGRSTVTEFPVGAEPEPGQQPDGRRPNIVTPDPVDQWQEHMQLNDGVPGWEYVDRETPRPQDTLILDAELREIKHVLDDLMRNHDVDRFALEGPGAVGQGVADVSVGHLAANEICGLKAVLGRVESTELRVGRLPDDVEQ